MTDKEQLQQLFALIEMLREYKGLSKQQLAGNADITRQYYGELLEAKKMPSICVVFRLLNALDADLMPVFRLPKPALAKEINNFVPQSNL